MGRHKEEGPRGKNCTCCGVHFEPILKGQNKCIDCIMKNEPAKPSTDTARMDEPDWVAWFIYNWRCIKE